MRGASPTSDRTSDVSTAFAPRGLRPTERPQRVAPAMRGVLARHEGRLCTACLAMELNDALCTVPHAA